MKKCVSWSAVVASLLLVAICVPQVRADVQLPKVISSHMVLQRDRPLPIWGWADPGEEVTVQLDAAKVSAKADAQGNWQVVLPAVKTDKNAHRMTVSGKNKIELEDILIGDVWIGSGQSNMEFTLGGSIGGKEAIAAANCPQIRLLHVEKVQTPQPAKDIVVFTGARKVKNQPAPPPATGPAWKVCTPQTVPSFSGVLYFFGQRLQKDLDVPMGLINSSWGGSPIEPWTVAGKKSGGMYNGMIAPVKPLAIRGAIWYQGESNVNQKGSPTYADKMKALIEGWRQVWGYEFPFYFVQIAPWSGRYEPGQLPALWEYQVASLKIPGTGMAVTTDVVENIKDIQSPQQVRCGQPPRTLGAGQRIWQEGPCLLGTALQVDEDRRQQDPDLVRANGQRPEVARWQAAERVRDCRGGRQVRSGRGCNRRQYGRRAGQGCRLAHPGPVRLAQCGQSQPGQQGGPAGLAVPNQQLDRRHGRMIDRLRS